MLQTFSSFIRAKKEMLEHITGLLEICKHLELNDKQKMLDYWQQKIMDNRFVLLVLGDFDRGKSSLINALLGDKILPAKMIPTTGAINIIKYGDEPKAVVSFKDENREPEEISFAKFREIVEINLDDEHSEESRVYFENNPIRYIEVFYPLELCKNGVEIVDTPGLNDDQGRSEITINYISKADAGIILLSAETFLAKNESKFIDGLIKSGFKNLFFVTNFIDLVDGKDEFEEVEEDARSRLTPLIADIPLRIFFLSAEQALKGKITGNDKDMDKSRFRGFERSLESFLVKERGKAFLGSSSKILNDICETIENTISERRELLKRPLKDLEDKQKKINPSIQALREKKEKMVKTVGAKKDKVIAYFVDELNDMMRRLATVGIKRDSKNWTSNVKILVRKKEFEKCAEEYLDQGRQYVQDKTAEWASDEVTPKINKSFMDLCEEIGDDSREIDNELNRVRLVINPNLTPKELPEDHVTIVERLLAAGALFLFNPAAAVAGGIFGAKGAIENFAMQLGASLLLVTAGLLNPAVLLGIGFFITIGQVFWKAKGKKEEIREKIVKEISAKLSPPPNEVKAKLVESIENAFNYFAQALDNGIESKLQEVERELNKVIEEKKLKGEESEQQLSELVEKERKVSQIRTRLASLI